MIGSKKMATEDDILRYGRMVEQALRGVVRQAIGEVMDSGKDAATKMPGNHNFYITFLTDFPGVQIPDGLRERYPGEMTIVLQEKFYDLAVDAEKMKVTLPFDNVLEKLVIPLSAITAFADLSVNFLLRFEPTGNGTDFKIEI